MKVFFKLIKLSLLFFILLHIVVMILFSLSMLDISFGIEYIKQIGIYLITISYIASLILAFIYILIKD